MMGSGRCNVIRAFAHNGARLSVGEENFGEGALPDPEHRYARATEFLEVVNALFDANDPAAAGSVSVDGAGRYSVAAWPWSAGPGRSAAKRAATRTAPARPDRH